ncbi:MAG: pyridoxal phosphate-dependent deaminase, putative [uncultured Sulfurovum sp.]|uniref:Pyridoxal phosphate-dependent deaminase, putative n=1 Tax=uncultured Sulfurovum sp. TaxID=269237 RepID=A0A6S6TU66_9BACT|nr:MAG: pyridoxal phosphate-dependent deaminase, putative [uncultured Sulfurovum sp.]
MKFLNSPIEKVFFQNQTIYIKRDDLLSKNFSGNKARKFAYFLDYDFTDVQKVVSYGSNQSNAMYSLSVLAKLKGWEFDYYVTHIPNYLEQNPQGNFKYALENGMRLIVKENKPLRDKIENQETLFIEEGGREIYAEYGLKILAQEIETWKKAQGFENINIFLPAGTGTTALYLQKNSKDSVYTVPCVGDEYYLKEQFKMLEENENFYPNIMHTSKKRHFGKLYRESYNIWLKLQDKMGIEFDLLYDPHGWLTLLENPQIFDKPILYIHQGGLIGNESMLARYKRKYDENI